MILLGALFAASQGAASDTATATTATEEGELAFPLPPLVVSQGGGPGNGHAWFPQHWLNLSGRQATKLYGQVHAEDDGCPNRKGCTTTSAGQCCQPCIPVGQSFSAAAPDGASQQPVWQPLSARWGTTPAAPIPHSPCARPNATAEGEVICAGWRWTPVSGGCGQANCSFTTKTAERYTFDARGTIVKRQIDVPMAMHGWPDLGIKDSVIATTSSNILELPGGALFQTVYFHGTNSSGSPTISSLAAVLSSDGGAAIWNFLAVVAPPVMIRRSDSSSLKVGPSESASAMTQSGRVRVVYRVYSHGGDPVTWINYMTTVSAGHSAAQLRQWGAPAPLATSPVASARPILQSLQLPDGSHRMLLFGGRPSLHVYLSADGEGERWLPGVSIVKHHNAHFGNDSKFSFCQPMLANIQGCPDPRGPSWQGPGRWWEGSSLSGTTGYTSVVPLAENRFLLTYDKLGNGWYGPLKSGPRNASTDIDAVFSLVIAVGMKSDGNSTGGASITRDQLAAGHQLRHHLKCDDPLAHHHYETAHSQPQRIYPASDVGMRGGGVGGPDGGDGKCPALPTARFPHGGLYDTWEAAAAFGANRLDWVYTWNATTIAHAHRLGLKFTSTTNANLPDIGTGMLGDPTNSFKVGRCENIDGKPLTAPWMRGWSPTSPAKGPAWGCVNKPEYRQVAFDFTRRVLEARPDALQHDDPELNAGIASWNGGDPQQSGCYCDVCMDKFSRALKSHLNSTEQHRLGLSSGNFSYKQFIKGKSHPADAALLRSLFVGFQTNSTISYLSDLNAFIEQTAERLNLSTPFPFSGNNNGVWQEMYQVFDIAIGELSQFSSNPNGLMQILVSRVPAGKQTVLTMPKWSNETFAYSPQGIANVRWAIAYTYAVGGNMLAPWDNYLPVKHGSARFYGDRAEFGDLFAFIRRNSSLFDNKTALADPPQHNFRMLHSGGGAGGDNYRFRLPSEIYAGNVTDLIDPSLPKCQAACDEYPGCLGVFWSEDDGTTGSLCALLPKLVSTFTHMPGQSYIRNASATGPSASTLLATTLTPDISLLARRSASQIVVHVVDWRYGDPIKNGCTQIGVCNGPMTATRPPIQISLDNARISGTPLCGMLDVRIGGPGIPLVTPLTPTLCAAGKTVVTLASPRPWVVLIMQWRTPPIKAQAGRPLLVAPPVNGTQHRQTYSHDRHDVGPSTGLKLDDPVAQDGSTGQVESSIGTRHLRDCEIA